MVGDVSGQNRIGASGSATPAGVLAVGPVECAFAGTDGPRPSPGSDSVARDGGVVGPERLRRFPAFGYSLLPVSVLVFAVPGICPALHDLDCPDGQIGR